MKRVLLLVTLCIAAVVLLGSCKEKRKTASQAAKEYGEMLKEGKYDEFVDRLYFEPVSAPEGTPAIPQNEVVAKCREEGKRVIKSRAHNQIQEKGGIKDVTVKSENVAPDGKTADVVLTHNYNSGISEDVAYVMILDDNVWKIRVTPHKEVWRTRTPDGDHLSFKLIDGENRDVFKENIDGDRNVVKDIERGNTEIHKEIRNGEKEVVKVKDKEDEVVIKTKSDGDREVTRIKKDA